MAMKLYGQAEYYYSLSCEMTAKLEAKGLITADQRRRIDKLDRKSIYEMYPSIDEMEAETSGSENAVDEKDAAS
jgi:hypothetical protein